ncbi:unnamed protein product, partial [marine sediment metagenome]
YKSPSFQVKKKNQSVKNYRECVSEDKDGLRQRLGCPGDYTRRF